MISNIYKQSALIFLGIVICLVGVMGLYGVSYNHKIYPFVWVGQNNLSNLNIKEAEELLNNKISKKPQVLELGFGNQTFMIDLNELNFNSQQAVKKAYMLGREGNIINNFKKQWRLWFKKESLMITYDINHKMLEEQVDVVVDQLSIQPIYYRLSLTKDNQVLVTPGKSGRVINREKLINDIDKKIATLDFSKIEVGAKLVEVRVSPEDLKITQRRGEKFQDKILILKTDEFIKSLTGQDLLDFISFTENFEDVKIQEMVHHLSEEVNREAQNAVFRFEADKVIEFKPALNGIKLDEEATVVEILKKLDELENKKCEIEKLCQEVVVELELVMTTPSISIEEINDLGIRELLGKGESTFHGSIPSRKHNVVLTANQLNGVLVKPGEVFSFNQSVGDISSATGYQSAYIIKDGRTILGDGGGVCQDSTTIFRAALSAGLPIIERHPHAYRVSYYEQNSPAGIDATIYSPNIDLKFLNDTPAYILIQTTIDTNANYLKIEIYGTSDGRVATISNLRLWDQSPPPEPKYEDTSSLSPGEIKQIDWAAWGAKAAFDWKVMRGHEVLQEKTFYSSYRPWQAVYLKGVE